MHALIIEDEPLIAMMIEDVLCECGFTSFDIVRSPQDAIAAVRCQCPDLITADVDLNPGSGVEAVDMICSDPPIPVVFITGTPGDLDRQMPQHPLILKPFVNQQLISIVQRILPNAEKALRK